MTMPAPAWWLEKYRQTVARPRPPMWGNVWFGIWLEARFLQLPAEKQAVGRRWWFLTWCQRLTFEWEIDL
jgi:hypothetical protein